METACGGGEGDGVGAIYEFFGVDEADSDVFGVSTSTFSAVLPLGLSLVSFSESEPSDADDREVVPSLLANKP